MISGYEAKVNPHPGGAGDGNLNWEGKTGMGWDLDLWDGSVKSLLVGASQLTVPRGRRD